MAIMNSKQKWYSFPLTGIMGGLFLLFAACSNVDEADRLVVINTLDVDTTAVDTDDITDDLYAPQVRNILIEDFTGQDCVNCPDATEIISLIAIKAAQSDGYGVVPVAIHSGPLGVMPSTQHPDGLATELGNTYYTTWGGQYQPIGLINRSSDGLLDKEYWDAAVSYYASEFNATASTNIAITPEYNATTGQLDVKVYVAAIEGATTGKLQVWLTEDNIVAFQRFPGNVVQEDYVHNHVLRCSLNGTWGEDISVAEEQYIEKDYSCQVDGQWNASQLTVVAFVTNDSGVVQVVKMKVERWMRVES